MSTDRDSLLPRSLFSASSLKVEPTEQTIDTTTQSRLNQQRRSTPRDNNPSFTTASNDKRSRPASTSSNSHFNSILIDDAVDKTSTNTSSTNFIHRDDAVHIDSNSSSGDTSSSSDEDDHDLDLSMYRNDMNITQLNNTVNRILLKLERERSKYNKYNLKIKNVNKSINRSSKLLSHYCKLLAQVQDNKGGESTAASLSPKLSKRSASFPESDSSNKHPKTHNDNSNSRVAEERNNGSSSNASGNRVNKKSSAPTFPVNKIKPTRKIFSDIQLQQSNAIDIFKKQREENTPPIAAHKLRSLLFNIADENMSQEMHDLMVITSLDGDLQFWDSSSRKLTKKITSDQLYDSWIDDVCWATPTTLAVCPPQKSQEDVKLVHIRNGSKRSIEEHVQKLNYNPHENGISVIASLNTGSYTRNSESCSFVTGGYDKSVYLWKLKRESPLDNFNFTKDDAHRLNIRHTSAVYALCYDKYKNLLYTGGADRRLTIYDMQANTSNLELKLSQSVSHIIQSKANPNITLLTVAQQDDQFLIFDQRVPSSRAIQLKFGQYENNNLSRYVRPEMHENGHTIIHGAQTNPRLNFWDIRYNRVRDGPSFSISTPSTKRISRSLFIPFKNTIVTISSLRTMSWLDYNVFPDQIVQS